VFPKFYWKIYREETSRWLEYSCENKVESILKNLLQYDELYGISSGYWIGTDPIHRPTGDRTNAACRNASSKQYALNTAPMGLGRLENNTPYNVITINENIKINLLPCT
jgi:hypothetical protein